MVKDITLYSVLLLAALGLAFATSERKDDVKALSKVWFSTDAEQIEKVVYRDDKTDTTVTMTPIEAGGTKGKDFWFKYVGPEDNSGAIRVAKLKANRAGKKFDPKAFVPKQETVAFKANSAIEFFVEFLTRLKALRVIGKKADLDLASYGLSEDNPSMTITTKDGKTLTLKVGAKSYGSDKVYALDTATDDVILISHFQVRKIKDPRKRLFENKVINVDFDEVKTATATVGKTSKSFVMRGKTPNATKYWYPAGTSTARSEGMSGWMFDLRRVQVAHYATREERLKIESLPVVFTLQFDRGLPSAESVTLRQGVDEKTKKPVFWVKSKFLTTYAKAKTHQVEKMLRAMAKVFPKR